MSFYTKWRGNGGGSVNIQIDVTPVTDSIDGRLLHSVGGVLDQTLDIHTNGNRLGIGYGGIGIPEAQLDIKSSGTLISDIAFRVRNSANTANIVNINALTMEIFNHTIQNNAILAHDLLIKSASTYGGLKWQSGGGLISYKGIGDYTLKYNSSVAHEFQIGSYKTAGVEYGGLAVYYNGATMSPNMGIGIGADYNNSYTEIVPIFWTNNGSKIKFEPVIDSSFRLITPNTGDASTDHLLNIVRDLLTNMGLVREY